MTGPSVTFDQQRTAAMELIQRASTLWIEAAHQSDSAAGLGIDGRIALVHGLVDVWLKSYFAWLDAVIKGGFLFPCPADYGTPRPSEVIRVAAAAYPRKVEFDGPLVRIGLPQVKILPPAVAVVPDLLLANATEIRIVLKDYRYIGSNYLGKLKLTSAAALANATPVEKVITVGL